MTSVQKQRRASKSRTRSSNSRITIDSSLAADHDADTAIFDTAELHREGRLGEFKLDALADAVTAGRAGRRDRFEALAALHDVDPAFRRQRDLIGALLRGRGGFNKSGKMYCSISARAPARSEASPRQM